MLPSLWMSCRYETCDDLCDLSVCGLLVGNLQRLELMAGTDDSVVFDFLEWQDACCQLLSGAVGIKGYLMRQLCLLPGCISTRADTCTHH